MEQINEMLVEADAPGVDTTELQQVGTSKVRLLHDIVTEMYMQETGVTLQTWDHDPVTGEYTGKDSMAVADILATEGTDDQHPTLQAALTELSIMRGMNRILQSTVFSGSQMVYEPQAEIRAVKEGEVPASPQEVDAAYDITDVNTSANPEFTGEVKGAAGIGTEASRQNYEMYNDFAYSSGEELIDKYGQDAVLKIGTETHTIYNIGRMTKDDRKALADDWAEANGITSQIELHGGQVDAYKEENKLYANYTDWRGERYDVADAVGVAETVQTMAEISPAYKKYIERLKPAQRDNPSIVFSTEAYEAWNGEKSNIYSEDESNSGGSAAALADWSALLVKAEEYGKKDPNEGNDALYGGSSDDGKKPKKDYEDTPAGLIEQLNDLETDQSALTGLYDQASAAYDEQYPNSGDDAMKSTGNDNLDALMGVGKYRPPEDQLNDMKEPSEPYVPTKLKDYYKWRDLMALANPGADTSIEAYVAWLEVNIPGTWDLTEEDDEE
jgi:hypothetical protein